MLLNKIEDLFSEAQKSIKGAPNTEALYEAKVRFLGKQGSFSSVLKELGKLSPEEKKSVGRRANEIRDLLEKLYVDKELVLKQSELNTKLEKERIDVTLPGPAFASGFSHPVWKVTKDICDVFCRLGYSVRTGPHVERDAYNFDALNMPPDHPARDLQDTFYINDGTEKRPGKFSEWVLRTHTSPVQIRSMLTEKPPLRVVSPGGVYRSDSDISHSPNFHQVEGLLIDREVSMSDLKGTLSYFAHVFFGTDVKVRLRPSYFPFVEPGAELDASCPLCKGQGCAVCKGSGWIELGGCGMVHPHVFKAVNLEYPKWNGFAFGMGVERIAIVKYGISHIGLFTENDLRFLEQFRL